MASIRTEVTDTIWHGLDPYAGFPRHLYETDLQGWGEHHPYLTSSVAELKPRLVVEIGVWKGASVATMATELKELKIDGVVIAVDTWLGSSEHWVTQHWFKSLAFEQGRPTLQNQFMANMLAKGLDQHVLPLPLDSLNAAKLLSHHNIQIDLLHLDGGHDYASVMADLQAWWPLVRPGGILIGDDYNTNGVWPEVRQAFDEYFVPLGLAPFDAAPPKCRIRKPAHQRTYRLAGLATSDAGPRRVSLGAPATGGDDMWLPAEGTFLRPFRWMATGRAVWQVDIPDGRQAAVQVKIPVRAEAGRGIAEQSLILVAGRQVPVQVRESALFARLAEPVAGRVRIELRTPEVQTRDNDAARGALAISVIA